METADISYRVADFLKDHPPFNVIADADLLALTANGRVKFHEPNEYILWKGEPHRPLVYVIQQGTVSLWDESADRAELVDVRGSGDLLGMERYNGARSCLYSARTESDVVVYGFAATDFETFVLKYPQAVEYISAEGQVTADYQPSAGRREPRRIFLHETIKAGVRATCRETDSIADVARALLASRADAIAVVDAQHRARAVVTSSDILAWVARGGGDVTQAIDSQVGSAAPAVGPDTSVTDAVLAMSTAHADALVLTDDGTQEGRLQSIVAPRDLGQAFGDRPLDLLRDIRHSATVDDLRALNQRSRAFVLQHLTSSGSIDWLSRFAHIVDVAIVGRAIALAGADRIPACWCFAGSSGRSESLTMLAPHVVVVLDDDAVRGNDVARADAVSGYERVLDVLRECAYLPRLHLPCEPVYYVASAQEWIERYGSWVLDPVRQQTHRMRSMFDLRAVHGDFGLGAKVEASASAAIDRDFVQILANDCLASLPPLTFFEDAVIDTAGEQSGTFRLEHSALRPLVDAARVFSMAAREPFGRSTLERFATAWALLPEHESVFREAADTFRIVLWQQGRVGIAQGTSGTDLPPSLLSRHDRHILKRGFRSILRVLELTADRRWVEQL